MGGHFTYFCGNKKITSFLQIIELDYCRWLNLCNLQFTIFDCLLSGVTLPISSVGKEFPQIRSSTDPFMAQKTRITAFAPCNFTNVVG